MCCSHQLGIEDQQDRLRASWGLPSKSDWNRQIIRQGCLLCIQIIGTETALGTHMSVYWISSPLIACGRPLAQVCRFVYRPGVLVLSLLYNDFRHVQLVPGRHTYTLSHRDGLWTLFLKNIIFILQEHIPTEVETFFDHSRTLFFVQWLTTASQIKLLVLLDKNAAHVNETECCR